MEINGACVTRGDDFGETVNCAEFPARQGQRGPGAPRP